MTPYRRDMSRVRPIALGIVATGAMVVSILVARPEDSRIAAPPEQKSVLSSHGPAAKAAAHAVPAAPKPTPVVVATPVRQSAPAARRHSLPKPTDVVVATASEAPAKPAKAPAPEPPLEGTTGIRVSADAPPTPAEPLVISDPQVVALSPSSVRITFRTNHPATTRASYGIDAPAVWTSAEPAGSLDHDVVLQGLTFSTTYQIWLHALDEYDQTQTAVVSLTTAPMANQTLATTAGHRIMLDGQPFFPLAVWAQCSDGYDSNIADGINLFMGDGCGKDRQLPARLAGRAFSIVDPKDADVDGRGVIGWYFPDEWDAFLQSTVTREELLKSLPPSLANRISFLTLTNHFYSHAAALPQGRGMYPALYSLADVVGFDLYPLQVWCKPAFGDVFDAQHELGTATGGKPTFQWIEVAPMEQTCGREGSLDPTAATVRAETWLAVAGGADGIGYFPNRWKRDIGTEIARTNRRLQELAPALLADQVPATTDSASVKVSARTLNGALYVIAVNTSTTEATQARITVEGISGRSATVLGDGTVVGADDTGFTDTFAPLAAKVFVIPPQGW
jgi:hypothetical protein